MARRGPGLFGVCGAATPCFPGVAGPAGAAESTAVTRARGAADDNGRTHRPWVEQEAHPGETVPARFAVQNLSTQEVTFRITAADGYFTATGRFNMLNSDQTSVAAGTWITVA